jgi:hypothetical protein
MPKVNIPNQETKNWTVSHRGEIFGALYATRNIDLKANLGKVRLSERLYPLYSTLDDADFLYPHAFIRSNADQTDRYWVVVSQASAIGTSGLLFKTSGTDPLTGWTQDALTSSPTDVMYDMEIFGQVSSYDRLVVARDNDLAMTTNNSTTFTNPSWWTTTLGQSALSLNHPHQLHRISNLLLVADGNLLHVIDDSLVVRASRIILPPQFQIIWIADDGYTVYLGTHNAKGGDSYVFPWRNVNVGGLETYDTPIPVYDFVSYSGLVKDGLLYTLNGKGQLLASNGVSSFEEVDVLPVFKTASRLDNVGTGNIPASVHPNGMKVIDGDIAVLLSATVENSIANTLEDMMSGIWVYQKDVGFYHKYGVSLYNPAAANNNWCSGFLAFPGALYETRKESGHFLAGAGIHSSDGATIVPTLQTSKVSSTSGQRGYFITATIAAADLRAFWQRLKVKLKKLEVSGEAVVVKYRVAKKAGYPYVTRATWVDGDTFDEVAGGDWDTSLIEVGDEIEVMKGSGMGGIAHISAISLGGGASGVDRIELDESISSIVSGTFRLMFNNFKKINSFTSTAEEQKIFTIAKRSDWIQFKIELRGTETSPEIDELIQEYQTSKR